MLLKKKQVALKFLNLIITNCKEKGGLYCHNISFDKILIIEVLATKGAHFEELVKALNTYRIGISYLKINIEYVVLTK